MKILHKIKEKSDVPWEEINEINCQAYEALEHADPRKYKELICSLENIAYAIDRPQAEMIVRNMRPKGQIWSIEQVKEYAMQKGVAGNWIDWYLVMNMCYNDYYNTAKIYGFQNDIDFYFNLAKDFIEDPDAEPHKVARYFT